MRKSWLPKGHVGLMTSSLVNVIYPSLILGTLLFHFTKSSIAASWVLPLSVAVLMAVGAMLGRLVTRKLPQLFRDDANSRSFIFMTSMPNYAFLPLLIAQNFWSDEETARVILASFGGDLFLWLFLIPILGAHQGTRFKIFSKPPVLSLLVAVAIIFIDHEPLVRGFNHYGGFLRGIGKLTVPVSMYVLGAQLGSMKVQWGRLSLHLPLVFLRLVVIPSLVVFLAPFFLDALEAKVIVLIATMPTAISSVIFAKLFRGSPEYCAEQVLISHCAALVSLPLWFTYCGFLL